jgi:hypothetical protein
MAKCQYSPDSGPNSHPSVSMTFVDFPMRDPAWSVAGLAYRAALAAPGHASTVPTKAASSSIVTPNN